MAYDKAVVAKVFEEYKCDVNVLGNKSGFDTKASPASKEYKAASVSPELRKAECLKLIPALDSGKILVSYIEKYVKDCGLPLSPIQRNNMFEGTKHHTTEKGSDAPQLDVTFTDPLEENGVYVTYEQSVVIGVLQKSFPEVYNQCLDQAADYEQQRLKQELEELKVKERQLTSRMKNVKDLFAAKTKAE